MLRYTLSVLFLSLIIFSCGEDDPCDIDMNSIECDQGDFDSDGVSNIDDSDPTNPCLPDSNNVNCAVGDFDGDGILNGVDNEPLDPCNPDENNLACDTGDFDNDGTLNGVDTDPEDPCVPNIPAFESIVIGDWVYTTFGASGRVIIKMDGTYEEISGELVSNGEITFRMWRINDSGELLFEVDRATLTLTVQSHDCESFVTNGFFEDINWRKRP